VVISGRERHAFDNEGSNLDDEEEFKQEWRKTGEVAPKLPQRVGIGGVLAE
jgi:hypothetical protein